MSVCVCVYVHHSSGTEVGCELFTSGWCKYVAKFYNMYGQYDSGHRYTSVAAGHVYGYARGQYSTGLWGTGVQTHMA